MEVKWTIIFLIGIIGFWLLIPAISDYGYVIPDANLIPMVSSHYTWNRTFGGIAYEEGTAIVETADGGFAISGRTASFAAIVNDEEVWLVRCDQDGHHLWNHTYGGGMKHGGQGHEFHKSVRLENVADDGFLLSSHTTQFSMGDADGWLIRTDANGNHLWNYTYGGPDDEYIVETVACSDGGFISGGFTENITVGNVDGWLLRTDSDGNHLWNYMYGSPTFGEVGYDVSEVSGGGFILTGWAGDFDCVDDPNRFDVDTGFWFVRVDADGNHLWNRTYGTEHTATYAFECQDGGFAIIGTTGNYTRGPTGYTGNMDVILLRTNDFGDHLWNRTYGGSDIEAAMEFAECSDGGFAIFSLTYTDAWGISDGWFIRTDQYGDVLWDQTYGGINFDQFWAGIITIAGDFVMVGLTLNFGAGVGDMWAVRIPDVPPLVPPPPIPPWIYGVIAVVIIVIIVVILLLYRRRS